MNPSVFLVWHALDLPGLPGGDERDVTTWQAICNLIERPENSYIASGRR